MFEDDGLRPARTGTNRLTPEMPPPPIAYALFLL